MGSALQGMKEAYSGLADGHVPTTTNGRANDARPSNGTAWRGWLMVYVPRWRNKMPTFGEPK
jgi:hypothetical protein